MWQWLSPHDALHVLRQLEAFGNLRIEDPFPWEQPEMWQRVREVVALPLVLHTRNMTVLNHGLQGGYADNFNCSGYVAEFMALAHAVEVAGYCCWHGSSLELGVGQAAVLHAAAAARVHHAIGLAECVYPRAHAGDVGLAIRERHTAVAIRTWLGRRVGS